jgi:hypothetical protein
MQDDLGGDMIIQQAAECVAGPYERHSGCATVLEVRSRFGLSATDAVEAIKITEVIPLPQAT